MNTSFTFTLDAELVTQAEKLAHELGITLDELVTRLLENYIRQHTQPNNPDPLLSREEANPNGVA